MVLSVWLLWPKWNPQYFFYSKFRNIKQNVFNMLFCVPRSFMAVFSDRNVLRRGCLYTSNQTTVGITKVPLVNFSVKGKFDFTKVYVESFESRSYLLGVTTAILRRRLSNMNAWKMPAILFGSQCINTLLGEMKYLFHVRLGIHGKR